MSFDPTLKLDAPAVLGGTPVFPRTLPLVSPSVPTGEAVLRDIRSILESGTLTGGPYLRKLEGMAADYLGVRHCVAVSSCTSGLMLVLRAAGLGGDVVLPSFTFVATAHAAAWNGLRPVFADIDEETLTLSPEAVRRAIGVRTSAILATHVFGTPCDTQALTEVARESGLRLFFDAAHAFGSRRSGTSVGGFGDAEVFSLTPTKMLVAGEGGIIATDDDVLAERCRLGRNYGNAAGDYDSRLIGLNARMPEVQAAVALASFSGIEDRIERRGSLAGRYRALLGAIPGLSFPRVGPGDRSTYNYLSLLIDPDEYGLDADGLALALAPEGVETRRYFSPPVHEMRAYAWAAGTNGHVPVTDRVSARVLTLPLWTEMRESDVDGVAEAIARIRRCLERDGASFRAVLAGRPSDRGAST